MSTLRFVPLMLLLVGAGGCDKIKALMGPGDSPDITKDADGKAKSGDLPGAIAAYQQTAKDHPDSEIGRAHV